MCLANKLIINFNKPQQIMFRNPQKKINIENFELQDLGDVDTEFYHSWNSPIQWL